MLWLLAIAFHVRYVRQAKAPWLCLTVVCMALGLMSKAMIVTLPFTLLLLDVWPLNRVPGTSWRRLVLEKAPLFALSAIGCAVQIRAGMEANLLWSTEHSPILFRLANASANVLAYVGMLVFPAKLAVQYPSVEAAPYETGLIALAVIGAFVVFAWKNRARAPYLLLGGLWFLGTLVPVSGIVQAGDAVLADRYTYVPQIGFFVIIVWGAAALLRERARYIAPACACMAILALAVTAAAYTKAWSDTATLFTAAAEKWPKSLKARMNAGYALAQKGELRQALPHYHAALELAPHLAETRSNYGVALGKLGQTDAAIAQFRRSIQDDPALIMARFNLATYLLGTDGGAHEASIVLRQVLLDSPELTIAHYWLGRALEETGALAGAREEYRKRLAHNPDDSSAAMRLASIESSL
jgi:Flp pilus assembly protein TadD